MSVQVIEKKVRHISEAQREQYGLPMPSLSCFSLMTITVQEETKKRQIKEKLDRWDLRMIRERALKDGHYNEQDIARIEKLYKGFIYKAMIRPTDQEALRVDPEIDEFWHTHLLFTRNYAAMCHEIAGRFIHHEPFDYGDGDKCRDCRDCHHCKGCSTG